MSTIPYAFAENDLIASITKECFQEFCIEFWSTVPGAGNALWSWHMGVMCSELQSVAERVFRGQSKQYDVVFNVSPGTSKSTICSILFPAWVWTRMPQARILTASHTDALVLDLSNKSRWVIKSDKYRACFPDISLRDDQDTKGYYINNHGGDRKTCTVAGKTPTGFHAHFIICLPYEIPIMTEDGEIPIGEIVEQKLPVRVLGYDHVTGQPVWRNIEAYEVSGGRTVVRLGLSNGSFLEATDNHPVYVIGKGYVDASKLSVGDEVICANLSQVWQGNQQGLGSLRRLLQQAVQNQGNERQEPPSFFQCQKSLRRMWCGHIGGKRSFRNTSLLFSCLPRQSSSWSEAPQGPKESEDRLRFLWNQDQDIPTGCRQEQVLLSQLCQQCSFREDVRERQSQLYSRQWLHSLFQRIREEAQEDKEERGLLLFPVRENGGGQWSGARRASHRLEQEQQQEGQSCSALQDLPQKSSRISQETPSTGKAFITSVERSLRIPDKVYNIRVEGTHNYFASGILVHNCDDPIDPKKVLSELETKNAREFLTDVIPTRKVDKEVTVTFLIMQRLGMGDPTEVMLDEAKKEGAAQVRHVCLPSELFKDDNGQWDVANVSPPVLADNYDEDGLMDPARLNRKVLQEYRARGELYYATQFLQRPYQRGGGMFKDFYFNQRVKAAPYVAKRIRYWDRASTDDGGCYTAGVLLARDQEGNFYVEHVVHGQWEPDERNSRMRAIALRDRTRYGPKQEPVIWVEAEGGSSGRDAWKGVARTLSGFTVREDKVTGKKEVRAEPWSAQLAAKNVYVVDDGTWDIANYVEEHCAFPLGPYKDQVDASSGAFNLLVGKGRAPTLKIYPFADRSRKGTLRLVVCDKDELANLVLEQRTLLVFLCDPLEPLPPLPLHGIQKLLETLCLPFADLHPSDYQERYSELIPPYDKPISEIVLSAQQGKMLWSFLLKKREPPAEIIVLQDEGDRRALSLAYAIVDALRLPRLPTLYKLAEPDWQAKPEDKPPNQFVYDVVKTARSMVL